MKIIVNLNPIKKPITGIGYYTKNIVQALIESKHNVVGIHHAKILNSAQVVEFINDLDTSDEKNDKKSKNAKRFLIEFLRAVPGTYFIKHFIISLVCSFRFKSLSKDGYVYFEPSFVPIKYPGKIVTTVHDLSFISHPESQPEERVRYLTKMLVRTLTVSDRILVDSDFIKNELVTLYPSYKSKITTLYLGVDNRFSHIKAISDAEYLESLKLHEDQFVLCVGTLEPRKNLIRLIDAYIALSNELRERYPLVLVGSVGWKNHDLESKLKSLDDKGQIRVSGYVTDVQLKCLYRSAAVFVYPSLYEGFGLPVIEAMSSGAPVVTSDIGATREVSGGAAELVDPLSVEDISRGLNKLLSSEQLRNEYRDLGLKRVQAFSWKKCASDLVKILNNI